MEYIYAALLLHKAGKEITESAISSVIKASGATVDDSRVKTVVASLNGVDIEKALSEAIAMPVSTTSGSAPAEKKEEKHEEKQEEAAEGLAALFG
jgi:large subunit ribosomal protein L12